MQAILSRSRAVGGLLTAAFLFSSAARGVDLNAPDRWWKFDDGSGTTAADSSGNDIDGTLSAGMDGSEWTTDAVAGGALAFNGVDDWVNVLDNDGLPASDETGYYAISPFTLALWAKPASDAQMMLVDRAQEGWDGRRALRIQKADAGSPMLAQALLWDGGDENATGTTELQVDQWYHIAMVSDTTAGADALRVFVDGQLEGTAWNGAAQCYHDSWFIGRQSHNGAFTWFQGVMDDVRLYRAALTDQEVADLFALTQLPTVSLTVTDADEEGTDAATFALDSSDGTKAVTVNLDIATGSTATYTDDYTSAPDISGGTLQVDAGTWPVTITVTPVDDTDPEGNETLTVTLLAGAGYVVDRDATSAEATIVDNDTATVWIEATDDTATEDTADTAEFTLHRDLGGPSGDALVTLAVSSGPDPSEYDLNPSGLVDIALAPGATYTITLTPTSDTDPETNQTVTLAIEPAGDQSYVAVTGQDSASVTILDDDGIAVGVQASDDTALEHPSAPETGEFTVSRAGTTAGALVVNIQVTGAAVADADYDAILSPVTIPDGEVGVTITVSPIDDDLQEPDETVILTIQPSGGGEYVVAAPPEDTATVTIVNDDVYVETISLASPDGSQDLEADDAQPFSWTGGAGARDFTVTISTDGVTFAEPITMISTTTSAELAAGRLAYETTYYWKVTGHHTQVDIDSAEVFSFDTLPDTKPPTVVTTLPAKGADDVDTGTSITITFSEAVVVTGLADVVAVDGETGDVTAPSPNKIVFKPAGGLAYDTEYTVRIQPTGSGSSIVDQATPPIPFNDGNEYTFTFTTWEEMSGLGSGEGCVPGGATSAAAALLLWLLLWTAAAAIVAISVGREERHASSRQESWLRTQRRTPERPLVLGLQRPLPLSPGCEARPCGPTEIGS